MEILLLIIYSIVVWLIFFKFKWLPWTIVSQVIVITLPIIALTVTVLTLNLVAPSTSDVRGARWLRKAPWRLSRNQRHRTADHSLGLVTGRQAALLDQRRAPSATGPRTFSLGLVTGRQAALLDQRCPPARLVEGATTLLDRRCARAPLVEGATAFLDRRCALGSASRPLWTR